MLVPALLLVAALPSRSKLGVADSGAEMCRRGHTDMCRIELPTTFSPLSEKAIVFSEYCINFRDVSLTALVQTPYPPGCSQLRRHWGRYLTNIYVIYIFLLYVHCNFIFCESDKIDDSFPCHLFITKINICFPIRTMGNHILDTLL